MFFSIIIATLNREKELMEALRSILNQTFTEFEVFIVDQSDISKFELKDLDSRIDYIHINQKGLSHARNVALEKARGDYICLVDDDAEYDKNFLLNAERILNTENIAILSGTIFDEKSRRYGQKNMCQKRKDVKFFDSFKYCMSSAMIIQKSFLLKYKFDENFGLGGIYESGEETDLVMIALEEKEKVLFDSELQVFHKVLDKSNIDPNIVYRYAKGEGALYRKHLKREKKLSVITMYIFTLIKHMVGIIIYRNEMRNYYKQILKGELEGFYNYKK